MKHHREETLRLQKLAHHLAEGELSVARFDMTLIHYGNGGSGLGELPLLWPELFGWSEIFGVVNLSTGASQYWAAPAFFGITLDEAFALFALDYACPTVPGQALSEASTALQQANRIRAFMGEEALSGKSS